MFDPVEGHLDPYGTTHAYAKSAKKKGAEIYLQHQGRGSRASARTAPGGSSPTKGDDPLPSMWSTAAGLWAREVGRMVGLELPVLAMEHMYLITEDMPEVIEFNQTRGKELMHCVDFDGEIYLRQERNGMLMGTYEKACRPWSPVHDALGFRPRAAGRRSRPHRAGAGGRLPALPGLQQGRHQEGHQRPLHLLAGRQPARRAGAGARAISGRPAPSWPASARAAASAWRFANWMIDGDPGFDVFAMDVARYGDCATLAYTNAKVRENYSRRFSIRYPERGAAGGAGRC